MTAGEWISYGNNNGKVAIQSTVGPVTSIKIWLREMFLLI